MPRMMSFALTEPQFLDGSKTVTRRMGWRNLKAGDRLIAVRKAMGLKMGEKVFRLGEIEVVSLRHELLAEMLSPHFGYGAKECAKEGFPHMTPREFVAFFCASHKGCAPRTRVNRIEFRRVK